MEKVTLKGRITTQQYAGSTCKTISGVSLPDARFPFASTDDASPSFYLNGDYPLGAEVTVEVKVR